MTEKPVSSNPLMVFRISGLIENLALTIPDFATVYKMSGVTIKETFKVDLTVATLRDGTD